MQLEALYARWPQRASYFGTVTKPYADSLRSSAAKGIFTWVLFLCILFYTIDSVRSVHTTEAFDDWFAGLSDKRAQKRIQARIRLAELGSFGDCEPVGEGVSEMRIHHGPGYRVYFAQRGAKIVILLAGGDKSTQSKDIKIALKLARQL